MLDNPIVFIDSGVGGLPYLKKAKEYMPDENFIYIADNENFPYGEKDSIGLKNIIIDLIETIVKKLDPKLIVIACNTASVVALSSLRERFGIPFVGVVPAIKPAGEYAANGIIGLLATTKTVTDPYTDTLISQFASAAKVEKYAGIDLVDFVENNFFSSTEKEKSDLVLQASEYFEKLHIDALVLGCTHFVYLKDYFKKSFSKNIDIIDSVEGVSLQIIRIIKEDTSGKIRKNGTMTKEKNADMFYITGNQFNKEKYVNFSHEFNLAWGGQL